MHALTIVFTDIYKPQPACNWPHFVTAGSSDDAKLRMQGEIKSSRLVVDDYLRSRVPFAVRITQRMILQTRGSRDDRNFLLVVLRRVQRVHRDREVRHLVLVVYFDVAPGGRRGRVRLVRLAALAPALDAPRKRVDLDVRVLLDRHADAHGVVRAQLKVHEPVAALLCGECVSMGRGAERGRNVPARHNRRLSRRSMLHGGKHGS